MYGKDENFEEATRPARQPSKLMSRECPDLADNLNKQSCEFLFRGCFQKNQRPNDAPAYLAFFFFFLYIFHFFDTFLILRIGTVTSAGSITELATRSRKSTFFLPHSKEPARVRAL